MRSVKAQESFASEEEHSWENSGIVVVEAKKVCVCVCGATWEFLHQMRKVLDIVGEESLQAHRLLDAVRHENYIFKF